MSEIHCWADGPATIVQDLGDEEPWGAWLHSIGSTCLLPDGHGGEHQWTPDDQIVIQFAGEEREE